MSKAQRPLEFLALFILALSVVSIHYFVARFETTVLIWWYSLGFVAYVYLIQSNISIQWVIVAGIVLRLALFFTGPGLSDDVYRFIWDGRLMHSGLHPFVLTPEELMTSGVNFHGLDSSLFYQLNSPSYHTIYPPISQFIFWMATFSDKIFDSISIMRGIIFLFEVGIIYLLQTYFNPHKSARLLAIYTLNPLVILELTGNLHFEGVMVFFVLLAIVAIRNQRIVLTGLALALGIGVKFIPLMFLPLLIRRIGWLKAALIYIVVAILLLVMFIPLLDFQLMVGLKDSLGLFFNHFEFNAGLYFFVRHLGYVIHGYDVIHTMGPFFSLIALGFILWLSFTKTFEDVELTFLFSMILLVQLGMATTVHPWYIIPLVAMSAYSGFIFPIVWSYFIFLTYAGYHSDGYVHPMFLIVIEYVAVAVSIVFDYKSLKKKCQNLH